MNRILEFTPSQEEAVVARVLVLVHQAVDEAFPSIGPANRQFTKTVFSGEGEPTSMTRVAIDSDTGERAVAPGGGSFGISEDTSPAGRSVPPDPSHAVPPPPRPRGVDGSGPPAKSDPRRTGAHSSAPASLPGVSQLNPMADSQSTSALATASTRLDSTIEDLKVKPPVDWMARILAAGLVAGLVVLAYVIFFM